MVKRLSAPCQCRAQEFDPGLGRPHVPRSTEVHTPRPLSRCSGAWQPLARGRGAWKNHCSRALPLGEPGSSQLELPQRPGRSHDNNNNNKGPSWMCSGEGCEPCN